MNFTTSASSILLDGKKVRIKGANWFGLENPEYALHGLWSVSMESVLDMLQHNGFNAIRLPFSAEFALGLDTLKCSSVNVSQNPRLEGATAGQMLDLFLEECGRRNILVMPDLHRLKASEGIPMYWYSSEYLEDRVTEAWLCMVRRCKRFPHVFAMDLKNEPHGPVKWTEWADAAERMGNAILDENPSLLIVVEGVEWDMNGEGSWWGGNLSDVARRPIKLDRQDKLVYSPHVYGPDVYAQPYFSDGGFPSNLESIWDRHFGYLAKKGIGAQVVGEWGGFARPGSKDLAWQEAIAEYFARNEIDWFYWCVNPNSGDTGGILQEDWKSVNTHKLELMKKACPNPTSFDFTSQTSKPPKPAEKPSKKPAETPPKPAEQSPKPAEKPSKKPAEQSPKPTEKPSKKPAEQSPKPQHMSSGNSGIVVTVIEEDTWTSGNTVYKMGATITNISAIAIDHIVVVIDADSVQQAWSVNDLGGGRYGLPSWITDNGGLKPRDEFKFGFIASGKRPEVTVTVSGAPSDESQPADNHNPPSASVPDHTLSSESVPVKKSELNLTIRHEGSWSEGSTTLYKHNVVVSNTTSGCVSQLRIFIEGVTQIWSATLLAPGVYGYPDWIANNGGLEVGASYEFGFISSLRQESLASEQNMIPQPQPQASNEDQAQIQTQASNEDQAQIQPQASNEDQVSTFLQKWPASAYESASKASGGDGSCTTYDAGVKMSENKGRLISAMKRLGLAPALQRVLMAYAFVETGTLSAFERDASKDPGGANFMGTGAINYGLFNLNYGMIKDIGTVNDDILVPSRPSASLLNQDTDEGVSMLVGIVLAGMEKWGLDKYVSYVRGGITLFKDPTDYSSDMSGGRFKVTVFKAGLSKLCKAIEDDASLLEDSRRVALSIPWV